MRQVNTINNPRVIQDTIYTCNIFCVWAAKEVSHILICFVQHKDVVSACLVKYGFI